MIRTRTYIRLNRVTRIARIHHRGRNIAIRIHLAAVLYRERCINLRDATATLHYRINRVADRLLSHRCRTITNFSSLRITKLTYIFIYIRYRTTTLNFATILRCKCRIVLRNTTATLYYRIYRITDFIFIRLFRFFRFRYLGKACF